MSSLLCGLFLFSCSVTSGSMVRSVRFSQPFCALKFAKARQSWRLRATYSCTSQALGLSLSCIDSSLPWLSLPAGELSQRHGHDRKGTVVQTCWKTCSSKLSLERREARNSFERSCVPWIGALGCSSSLEVSWKMVPGV
jgi:hypothetical protein